MKTFSRIALAIVAFAFCSLSARAQFSFGTLLLGTPPNTATLQSSGSGTITFPAGTGTLIASSTSSPSAGSLLYASGAGAWTTLTPSTNTYVLTLTEGVPAWQPEAGFSLPYSQTFAPGASTAAFAITNTSTGGYAIEGIDNSSGFAGGVGVRGQTSTGIGVVGITTNGIAGVDAASSGSALGLYCINLGTGISSNSAIGTYTDAGNPQPNISINTFGSGPDIEGTNNSWQVIDGTLGLGLNGTTNPIGGQLNILDGTSPGNAAQLSWVDNAFEIQMSITTSATADPLEINGQETSANGGAGGDINISAGNTGGSSGTGGNVLIKGGDESGTLNSNGGGVAIFGGFGGENSGVGGGATLNGGPGGGASKGGPVEVIGGSGGTNISGTGGAGGNSYLVGGPGGNVSTGTNGSGGAVVIEGGLPGTGGVGGSTGQLYIQDVGGNTQIGNSAGTVNVIGPTWTVDANGNGTFNSVTTTGNVALSSEIESAVSGNPSTVTISGNKASAFIEPGTANHNITASVTATPVNGQLLYVINDSSLTITLGNATILPFKCGACIFMNDIWWGE